MKMHSSEKGRKKWVCQFCNTSFSESRTLRDHIAVKHSKTKPQIPCADISCNKSFFTRRQFRVHMITHKNDDSKKMCPECGILLTTKHNLDKHLKSVHLRLRSFFCDICGYSASFKHSIESHMVPNIIFKAIS